MRVVFIPDYSEGNIYQKALADSLLKEGVTVGFGMGLRRFPVAWVLRTWRKPNILHLHWQHPFLLANNKMNTILKSTFFIIGLLVLKLSGIKIVWTVHNITSHERRFNSLELFYCRLLARLCNKIIVHGPSVISTVMNAYKVNEDTLVTVIPHGSYVDSYPNTMTREQARNRLGFDTRDKVYLYFGLIRPYKGVAELIEAFKELDAPQAKLLIAGRPYNTVITEDILKRCKGNKNISTVFEFIPDSEIQTYMNASDIVVLPYQDILTSGAVILAMSFGKPVVAPAIGHILDVLDNQGGFLYDPSDEEGLPEAMQLALGADLTNMGKHNFRLASELRWDDIAKSTREVYEKCLAK